MRKLNCLTLLAIFGVFFTLTVSAQSIKLQSFLSGLSSPVFITNAGDGTNRLFVVQQGGIIKVVQPGSTTATDFLNISSVISTGGERGLLGLAFHPNYETNRRFFVYYTRASDGDIQIAEYQALPNNPNAATFVKIIITIEHTSASNHNGGTIAFGADGLLYAGTGDGGGGNDPNNNAQRINNLLGKFIRINIDNTSTYSIPPGNPFMGVGTDLCDQDNPANGNPCQEIYAYGLRNPYRFSFDRGGTGQLYAGDVGQGTREEIDIITLGANFGWRIMEGTICTPGVNPNCTPPPGHIPPIYEYNTGSGGRCSITGGYVYRGTQRTLTSGTYIYGDFCSGEILTGAQQTLLLDTDRSIVSFGEDEAGELYVVGIGGTVEKITSLTTAATATVSGRVMTASGRGIRNVLVTMTDESGNVRTARSTSFGLYRFADVPAGATYIFTVSGKRFTFRNNTRVQSIVEDTDDINFVASSF
jgi:glucose/arabinose dehydrogenase